ncbi:MAG: tetratricopeptide repeat protein [Nitrospirae bacterium]|nr:tetratricopeptide repeat protein [Nitrospirota bacterium]
MDKKTTPVLDGTVARRTTLTQCIGLGKRHLIPLCLIAGLIVFGACSTSNKTKQVKAHYSIGVAKLNENDISGAFVEFKKALELNPYDKESLNALGLVYLQLENYDQAKQSLLKAISVDPKYSEAYNNLGLVYVRLNKWEDAATAFSDALKNPLYAAPDKAYNNLGYSFYRLGRYGDAITAFKESIKRNETSVVAFYGLSLAHNAIAHYGDASVYLMEAIKLDPNYAGNTKKALEDFKKKRLKGTKQEQKDNADFMEILNY